jgi:hypothetical protein
LELQAREARGLAKEAGVKGVAAPESSAKE